MRTDVLLLVALVASHLSAEAPCLDRWGDPLPEGAILRLGTTRFRSEFYIEFLAVSPDGSRVAAGGSNDAACVWDAATGRILWSQPFRSHG